MTPADAADDVYNDVYDDDSSRHSDVNIWDYRVTITVSVFFTYCYYYYAMNTICRLNILHRVSKN